MNSDRDSYVQGFCTGVLLSAVVAALLQGAPALAIVGLIVILLILIAGEVL